MGTWAVIESNNTVSNLIVADEDFINNLKSHISDDSVDTGEYHAGQTFEEISSIENPPSIGFIKQKDGGYVPPEQISSDKTQIPPDGKTVATVTYTDNRPNASGGDVIFSVNGKEQPPETLLNSKAQIQVASFTAGDYISVSCGSLSTSIEVTE